MVRAGVVNHPSEWPFCGYNEIQKPRQRYSLIDYGRLIPLLQMRSLEALQGVCRKMVEERSTETDRSTDLRESRWTESIAVGNKKFIEGTFKRLGVKAKGRKIVGSERSSEIRDPAIPYIANFDPKISLLRSGNTYLWNDSV